MTPVLLAAALAAAAPEPGGPLEDRLYEAVFRQQKTELLDAETRRAGVSLCLSIDPGGAPQSVPKPLLDRLGLGPAIRRGAECEVRMPHAVQIASGSRAILVTAGPIEWIKDDEAWVTVTQTWSASRSLRRPYRVVREPDGAWVALGPILIGAPG
jgi:hypothetical protein